MGGGSSRPWTELSGETNWKDMLDPLDEDLRMYLIHYGERVQAIYDAYNAQYEVTRYFYVPSHATFLEQPDRSWAGYVAVSTDEGTQALGRRDILVTWRGTANFLESMEDIRDDLAPANNIFKDDTHTKIHAGFLDLYTKWDLVNPYTRLSARDQVLREVRKQVDLYAGKGETISITVAGHSLGAALATINALDILTNGYNAPTDHPENACLVTAFPFASPNVGDENFQAKFSSSEKLRALRVTNALDIAPFIPPIRYYHVGEQLLVDSRKSPDLKPLYSGMTGAVAIGHMLETCLHLIAGTQGIDSNEFNVDKRRGIELVNKGMDALKDERKIPAYWLVAKNKNMVQDEVTGDWSLAPQYIPPPPEDN
ncbi:phospholipase A1-IIgamma [Eucalyptus grandis]|uniref:phospholipase A1-IIgamma n=1 Tax=Eucalyptus grandis TaxID=71139 RepID=UPI00192E9BFD|nr:phospholipase A1-IIgamma [Eucalyptus grandis]